MEETAKYIKRGTEQDWEVIKGFFERCENIREVEISNDCYLKISQWLEDFSKIYSDGLHWKRSKERQKGFHILHEFFKYKVKLKTV